MINYVRQLFNNTAKAVQLRSDDAISKKAHRCMQELFSDYEVVQKLGEGTCSHVFHVRTGDEHYALKVFKSSQLRRNPNRFRLSSDGVETGEFLGFLLPECKYICRDYYAIVCDRRGTNTVAIKAGDIESFIQCPNILKDDERTLLGIVMEYVEGAGDLFEKREEVQDIQKVVFGALSGVEVLHRNGIMHRDIKLENFLFCPDGTVKLSDFGFAGRINGSGRRYSVLGTFPYLDPKVATQYFDSTAEVVKYSRKIDVYALAVVFFALSTKTFPNEEGEEDGDYYKRVNEALIGIGDDPELENMENKELANLISMIGNYKEEERIEATEALRHPFLHGEHELFASSADQ